MTLTTPTPAPPVWHPAEGPPAEPRDLRGAVTTFGVVTAALVLVGAPMGLLWAALAPGLDLQAVSQGSEQAFTVQLSADLVLGAQAVLLGLGAGVLAWRRPSVHGAATVLGLAVGGVLAGLVAARVGYLSELPTLQAALTPEAGQDAVDLLAFRLRLRGVLVVLPLVAVGTWTLLTGKLPPGSLTSGPASPTR